VFLPKANGKLKPLGILTVRDRACMTAALLVLKPIFEADLPPEIYAYIAGRNAQQAAFEVEERLFRGHPEVLDADLVDYFGSILYSDLLKSVACRIVDRRVLHLVKMWLGCPSKKPTNEDGRQGRRRPEAIGAALRGGRRSHHCRRISTCAVRVGWMKLGLERSLGTRSVTYSSPAWSGRHPRAAHLRSRLALGQFERHNDRAGSRHRPTDDNRRTAEMPADRHQQRDQQTHTVPAPSG
jgi:hypothetical protein